MFNYHFQEGPEKTLVIVMAGELDTLAAQPIQKEIELYKGKNYEKVLFEMSNLTYMASSGLRVIFYAQKNLGENVKIEIKGAKELVAKILQISGMSKYVTTVP
ncbi:MAG: STAS domain-containing protein [Verrucomicrobiae bacterium]|nr:STAS domain-containing protein [Verrucomicrobiae bacterium]